MDEALDHPPLQMVLAEEVYAALVVGLRGAGAEGIMETERLSGDDERGYARTRSRRGRSNGRRLIDSRARYLPR